MLRLRLFGGLMLDGADAPSAPTIQRKALALLALVADANSHGVSRDKLHAWFWPESDTDHARNALNQLLFHIRRELGSEILTGTTTLQLNAELIGCDLWDFRSAIAA